MYNKFRGRTICRFPHRLEEHPLGRRILQIVNRHLEQAGLRVQDATIVEATIIHAPREPKESAGETLPGIGR